MNTPISNLIYYNSVDLFNIKYSNNFNEIIEQVPGSRLFSFFYRLLAGAATITDRTNVISVPVNTYNLPFLKLPEYVNYTKTIDEISFNRARWLMDHAKNTNRKLVLSFSGGIDSTLMMVSFLKSCTKEELKENVLVLLNEVSVFEYRLFCEKYIYSSFDIDLTYKMTNYLGDDNYIFVTGEGNDQLHGSSIVYPYIISRGNKKAFSALDLSDIRDFYYNALTSNKDGVTATLSETERKVIYTDIEKVMQVWNLSCSKAPIPMDNAYKYFWWVNFTMRWQAVYTRILSFAKSTKQLKLEDNYFMFYSPEEFQLWAMNNSDTLCGETWSSYKQHCKQVIFDFTKDQEYNKFKTKVGSLNNVFINKKSCFAIDKDLNYYNDFPGFSMFNKNNTLAEYDN